MGSNVSFSKKNIKDIFKLSPAQEGMLAYYLQFPNGSVFFERLCVLLRGEIDRNRFAQAWNFVVEGNDALRTVFRWEQIQTPVQVVLRRHQPRLLFNESLEGVMDLGDVPLVVELHELEGDRYEMVLNYHHIILDGWSSGIVLREFFQVYDALSEEKHVAPLEKTSFKNYVSFLQKQDKTYLESFWKEYLNFGQTASQVPVRAGNISNLGHYSLGLGSQLSGKINDYNRERKTSLSSLLYAAWGLLLSRYLDSGEIVFDTTVSGRSVNIDGIEEMTGLLINTLPIYFQLDDDRAPEDLVRELQAHLNRRQEFETTSRSIIQKFLRQPAAMPPFTSVLAVENYPVDESLRSPERRLWIEHVHILEQTLHDLTVIVETGPELTISVSYNEKLFDRKSIALLFEHFQTILTNILEPATDRAADLLPVESEALSEAAESLRRQIAASTQQTGPAYVAPGSDIEQRLAEVWAVILNIDVSAVGIDHDFFAYGGHSLKASALAMRLTEEFDAKIPLSWVFQHPTIRQQYKALIAMDRDTGGSPAIVAGDVREHYPVASAQGRLYFLWQLDRDSVAYNSPVFMTLKGELDVERLQEAVTRLVQHHEVLRTTFVLVEGRPRQKIHASVDCPLERLPKTDLETVKRVFVKPFDLDRGPLVRMALADLGTGEYVLAVDMHHIIADGISRDILTAELARLYRGEILAPHDIEFRDYCLWQRKMLDSGAWESQKKYWNDCFAGELPALNMATDLPRPATPQFQGKRLRFDMEPSHVAMVRRLMASEDATLFMVFLTLLQVTLGKYSRQEDVVVGTAVAGRSLPQIAQSAGLFLETLALKGQPQGDKPFSAFLREVRRQTLDAFANQDYPFRELLRDLGAGVSLDRNPLFDVMLIVQNHQRLSLQLPDIAIETLEFDPGIAKLDITFEVFETAGEITVELEYDTQLYFRDTSERMWHHVLAVLEQAYADQEVRLEHIGLLSDHERHEILELFNTNDPETSAVDPVLRQLAVLAAAEPHWVAVCGPSTQMTYGELLRFSRFLALQLQASGVRQGDIVSVSVDRGVEMIASLLAIWMAGGAYLPVDSKLPAERRRYLIDDSCAGFAICGADNEAFAAKKIFVEEVMAGFHSMETEITAPETEQRVENHWPAYVIYTSGSTGRPKGVLVSHGNLAANMRAFLREFDISSGDVVVQQASVSFDTFGEEVYPLLLKGGRIVCPDADDVLDVGRLSSYIARHSATILDCSPLLLNELNRRRSRELRSLRLIISGGDVLRKEFISGFLNGNAVYNTYGPTESTICATYHRCLAADGPSIPIGTPIAGYKVYIMDPGLRLLPRGIPGELCVAGPGVTQGYLNNPELTAQRFVDLWGPNFVDLQAEEGDVLYRTGDLARWLPDGSLDYIGRIDQQIKIRGFRIELGEIEHHLLKHDAVKEACVLARQERQREKFLAAYVAFEPGVEAEEVNLRGYLAEELPDYMIPAYFITVAALPYTSSGKIDRRALPEPSAGDIVRSGSYVAPQTEQEKQLTAIWRDILAIDSIGVQDNFFELGGDSILANRVVVKIRDEMEADISLRDFFQHPTIASLGKRMPEKPRTVDRIPRVSRDRKIPLSFPQERLWFLQKLHTENRSYNVPRALRLKGYVNVDLFEEAFSEIVRRHEIFRTIFPQVDGEPVQQVQPPYKIKIARIDFSDIPAEELDEEIEEFIMEEGKREFYLVRGPMLRVSLLKLTEEDHVLVTTEHHLVHDGWTQGILLNEFIQIYTAFSKGEPSPLPELPIQYADFAVWQRETIRGERLENHLRFWERNLQGAPALLHLPGDFPRPQVFSGKGDLHRFSIPSRTVARLKAFCQEHSTTLFIAMVSVFKLLLHRYSGSRDICVGTGIANRSLREMDGMMGMVVNTIALRTKFSTELSFSQFMGLVRETCVEAYEHEETPFDKVVDRLSPKRSLSYSPIFQVMFSFMDTPTKSLELPDLRLSLMNSHNRSSKFDISVVLILPREGEDLDGEILVDWEYSTDIFSQETMKRMGAHYLNLLDQALQTPETSILDFDFLSQSEKRQLLIEFNDNHLNYDRDISVIDRFLIQAAENPSFLAVKSECGELSYGELHRQSTCLANFLKSRGAGLERPVAVMMERSIEMLIGILAVLKAGSFYLPIDVFYPPERKKFLLNDANVALCLTNGGDVNWEGTNASAIDVSFGIENGSCSEEGLNAAVGENLAYVIYTSGSTGVPKGVLVEHRQINNCVAWMQESFPLTSEDCVASRTNLTFDPSVWELFWPLSLGASINVLTYIQSMDVEFLIDLLAADGQESVMYCPASLLTAMTSVLKGKRQNGWDKRLGLRWLFIGAEAVRRDTIEEFHSFFDGKIVNTYGPTECTINNTFTVLEPGDPRLTVPIGKPVANNKLYILGKNLELLPRNVPGEICIAGESLARGYLNSVDKTTAAFVPNPLGEGRLYRTGDLGKWLNDGSIEIQGRIDTQLKIRGYRVEPAEIQNRLHERFQLEEVYISAEADETGAKHLVAYIVADSPQDRFEMRRYLAGKLPEYMVPADFVQVDAIPLTPNGKVDVHALQKIGQETVETYTGPRSILEERLVDLWCRILKVEPGDLSQDSNFFENGGHSLSVIRLVSLLHQELNVVVPVSEIFLNPTISGLRTFIQQSETREFKAIDPVEKKEFYPLTPPQRRLYFLHQLDPLGTAYNIPMFVHVSGPLDREIVKMTLRELIMRHESLHTYFVTKDGEPVQRIAAEAEVCIQYEECNGKELEEYLAANHLEDFIKPFQLGEPPLLRVGLVRLKEDEYILMVDMHHIITDGASMNVLVEDFASLYNGRPLAPLSLRYRDFAEWSHRSGSGAGWLCQEEYWLEQFSGQLPRLFLPLDHERTAMKEFEGETYSFEVTGGAAAALNRLASDEGTTLYIVCLAVYYVLLFKLSGQEDIVVGTDTLGRNHADLANIIGLFINTLALRNYPAADKSFRSFLAELSERTIKAFDNQDYPFDKLVERVYVDRDLNRNPLFDVAFYFHNEDEISGEEEGFVVGDLSMKPIDFRSDTAKFDLMLSGRPMNDRIGFTFEFSRQLFRKETIASFAGMIEEIIVEVCKDKEVKLGNIDVSLSCLVKDGDEIMAGDIDF